MTSLFEGAAAPITIRLRPYQTDALESIERAETEGFNSLLAVLATGLGKTTIFAEQIRRDHERNPKFRTLVLAHRAELIEQGAKRIQAQNPNLVIGIESGSVKARLDSDVIVASVQSIGRSGSERLAWFRPNRIITDEAHHACADGYVNIYRRSGVFEGICKHLGVTATAHRLDNKPLHGREKAIFQHVAVNYGLREGILDGWLADLKGYRVGIDLGLDKIKKVRGDFAQGELAEAVNTNEHNIFAFEQWRTVARERKTIAFCVDVNHAKDVRNTFLERGVRAEYVHGAMDRFERDSIISRFKSGEIEFLANVEIATEGFDVPDLSCVLMLRPTQSWALFVQMIGRGTRTLPGVIEGLDSPEERRRAIASSDKANCIILDVVDLTSQHSAVNLPAAVGLPASLDLEGKGLDEAFRVVDSLGEAGRGWLFGKPRKLSDIPKKLTEVDLLAELETPEEIKAISKFSWMQVGEESYQLSCGQDENESRRIALLYIDTLGEYHLELKSDKRLEVRDLGFDKKIAFSTAESTIRFQFPGSAAIASASARWRSDPPTAKQLDFLRKYGSMDEFDLSRITKGQATLAMDKVIAGWNQRKKR